MIVGRGAELARLDRLLEDVAAGVGGRLIVVGEPGIGKSALVKAVARRASGHGHQVLRMSCAVGEAAIPFVLLDDIAHRAGVPAMAGRTPAERAGSVIDLLEGLAENGPVLIVADDVHEADCPSLQALAQAFDRIIDAPVGAVVSARPYGIDPLMSWPRIELRELEPESSVAILRSVLGSEASVDMLMDLAARQHGNPLALSDARAWLPSDWAAGGPHPIDRIPCSPAVVRSWQPTLARLSDSARSALLALAVSDGRPDLLDALVRSLGLTVDDLDDAARLGIVALEPRPCVVSGAAQSVVRASAAPSQLRDMHRRAAHAAEELELMPALIVAHWVDSVAAADAGVADRVECQAERAEQLDQLGVASAAWQSAALLSTSAPERVRRAQRGVSLIVLNGLDYTGADELVHLLEGVELDAQSAIWVQWLAAVHHGDVDPVASLGGQLDAIRQARDVTPVSASSLLWDAAMNAWTLGRVDEGLQAAREYVELEQSGCSTTARGWTVVEPPWTGVALLAAGLFQAGHVAEAMSTRERAIAMSQEVAPNDMAFDQLLTAVFLDDVLLDTSPAARERLETAAMRVESGSPIEAALYGMRAWQAKARGDWATARRLIDLGRPIAWSTAATGVKLGIAALTVELSGACGDDGQLKSVGDQLRALGGRMGDARRLATLDRAVGLRALVDGRLEVAAESLTAAADVAFLGRGLRDAVIPARVDLIEVLVRLGDEAEATRRAADVRALLMEMGTPDARALAFRVDALASAPESAGQAFDIAVKEHGCAVDPFERARTALLAGETLRRARQRSAARAMLVAAEREFDILGAAPWLARTRSELRAAGGQVDVAVVAPSLTAQERAVAEAVATGMSNREVADALFLSPRTVEYHLSSVYRKIGVHGRSALAQWFARVDAGEAQD